MVSRAWLVASVLGAVACADIVGISPLPTPPIDAAPPEGGAPDVGWDGPAGDNGFCLGTTTVLTTSLNADTIGLGGGLAYAGDEGENVVGCPIGATCQQDSAPLATVLGTDSFESFALGSKLYFSVQGAAGASQGTLHAAGFNGANDQVLLANLAYPLWVVQSNDHVFWVDDHLYGSGGNDITPSTVHCYGCTGAGKDSAWITGLNETLAMVVDPNNVLVVAGDGSPNSTDGIYLCSLQTACGGSPRVVTTGLDGFSMTAASVAGDGTNVYVARQGTNDIARFGPNGPAVSIVTSVVSSAIAVDPATNDFFFSTDTNDIVRLKLGTSQADIISHCGPNAVYALGYDATHVYVLADTSAGGQTQRGLFSMPRP